MKLPSARWFTSLSAQEWLRGSSVVGIASAVFIAVCANLLAARFDHRWDATTDHRYTLSSATKEALGELRESVRINVLLSRSDPLAVSVQQVIQGYLSATRQFSLLWVDPDRDPGQYLALQSELGITPGASKEGKSINESVVVLSRGKYRSYVTIDDILTVNPKTGEGELRLEQALTRGLRHLADTSRPPVCLTEGHRELNPADEGPAGLSELRTRLLREPIELRNVDLGAGRQPELRGCRVVIVAAPDIPLSTWAQQQLQAFVTGGGSLLVLSNTIPTDSGQVHISGLNPIVAVAGVSIEPNVVIEKEERQRLPDGFGETFFAQVTDHAVTRALFRADAARSLRVLVSLAPALHTTDLARTRVLLATSDTAISVENVSVYLRQEASSDVSKKVPSKRVLAVAAELDSESGRPPRRLIVAPASIVENRALRLPALAGNRAFIDGALTWLLARPVGVEISNPERTVLQMTISEAELAQLVRYVLFIMPASIAGIGLAVALAARRRRRARNARQAS